MNDMVPLIVGVASTLAGTALGAGLQHHFGKQQQRAARLHESKITLYGDVYTDLAATEQWLTNITSSGPDYPGPLNAPDRASTSGRLHLLAPPPVVEAWTRHLRAAESLHLYERESGIPFDMGQVMLADHELVFEARAAIEGVRRTVQADLR
ncbi:hypothetical protein ACFUYE_15030 [Micromonospora humida]|uniref:hypothetical protein n=1 Tax=Micromonospora humida TaxID=2809018 RepID=UPI0036735CCA